MLFIYFCESGILEYDQVTKEFMVESMGVYGWVDNYENNEKLVELLEIMIRLHST